MGCRRLLCISFISFALVEGAALAQTAQTESQWREALLTEVRQLRQAMQTSTIAAQRIQISLYQLQTQLLAVARATQRFDDARSKVAQAELTRKRSAAHVERLESLQSQTDDQRERKNRELDLRGAKGELEMCTSEEQQLRTIESEAMAQVQLEQVKLAELQDRLNQLDKALGNISQGEK
jgi:hypothetical protein